MKMFGISLFTLFVNFETRFMPGFIITHETKLTELKLAVVLFCGLLSLVKLSGNEGRCSV